MEIYRQAAIATAASGGLGMPADAVVTDCEVRLSDFAELQAQLECSAVAVGEPHDGRVQIAAALHQFDREIGSGQVGLRFLGAAQGG